MKMHVESAPEQEVRLTRSPKVATEEGIQEIILDVLTNDKQCGVPERFDGADAIRVEGGKAAYQLTVLDHRMPIEDLLGLRQDIFRGLVRSILLADLKRLNERASGEWRPAAARLSRTYRMRFERVPSGANHLENTVPNWNDPKPNPQRTKLIETQDPVFLFEVAYVDVTGAPPVDGVFERIGRRTSNWYRYAESGGQLRFMPSVGRKARERAVDIICYSHGVDPSAAVEELAPEDLARVQKMLKSGLLDVEEIAGALNISVASIEKALGDE